MIAAIREAGGEIYALTSEPQSLATNAQNEWDTGFEHIGDPHQEILQECATKGWLSLFVNDWGDGAKPNELSWVSHPKGYFQPGVLALRREGRVLYRWRSRPTRENIGGAISRPTASHVWGRVKAALAEPAAAPDVPHDDAPQLDQGPAPWPVFVTLLFANGWFLRPVYFHQDQGESTVRRRMRNAMLRVPLFVAAWIAAFAFLPFWIAGLAFVAWVAKIVPGVRQVNALFQNVGPEESPG